MMLQAANCIGAGVPFLDFPAVKGRAVYVNTEISVAAWEERCRCVKDALHVSEVDVWHVSTRGLPLTMHNLCAALQEALARKELSEVDALFLDPWYTLAAGVDENAAGEVAEVMLGLQKLAEDLGAAVWIAHHFTKGNAAGKSMMDRASGSGAFARAVDVFMTITEDEGGQPVLEVARRNAKYPAPLAVEWDFPLWRSLGESEPVTVKRAGRPSLYSVEDLLAVFKEPGARLRRKDFVENGIDRHAIDRLLADAARSGRLVREGELYRLPTVEVAI